MKQTTFAGFGTLILVFIVFFFATIFATVIGGVIGWVVGLVFPFVITTLNQIAGTSLTAFQVGAVLGFFGDRKSVV